MSARLVGESVRARREAALQHAATLEPREASKELGIVAELDRDPILMVAAAEAALEASSLRDPSPLKSARARARQAEELLDELDTSKDATRRAGLDRDEVAVARSRVDAVIATVSERERRLRVGRNGRGELISGAVLTSLGVAGLGVMTGGLLLDRAADRELAAAGLTSIEELPSGDREAFAEQLDRASTMTAVGAVVGATASALGVTLVSVGVRDLRRGGVVERPRAALRLSPAIGGVVLAGRF